MRARVLAVLALAGLSSGCFSFHRGPLPGEPAGAAFLTLEGTRVRYLDVGRRDAPAVVLVHGFGASLDTWDGLVPELARTHRVLALDLRGFGWTDRPAGDYSPAAQAALVAALLDARGVARASVVGHSFGASVALALALDAPDRVDRLVLYDAYVYEEQVPAFFAWSRARGAGEVLFALWYRERADERLALGFHDPARVTEKMCEDLDAALHRPGTLAAHLACARGQRFAAMEPRYESVRQPVLLLWGGDDAITPIRSGRRLARELPRATLHVLPACGHFPMLEAPAASNRAVLSFLRNSPRLEARR